ncbi:DUF3306 domain-containing protein [Sediminicoccus sp. KRV36]|uniref:DUF3306 domain-containing protein n=1 Tax=Sediminicoccus sp. KRV36 TaxID=3133721 RepID=UPI00200BDC32|nr:DUF3306 domain-containing protein [Sediminicoccus rosea]UPY37816.1 DUF3306 domain-containing protein [Sediminicoccus rosea]
MPSDEEQLGFLSRWSRRKRGEEVPEPAAEPALIDAAPPPEVRQALAPEAPMAATPTAPLAPGLDSPPADADAPEFDLASLPPIETLDASSDFTQFLKPGVPQALRAAALRKAWTADPLIRDYMSPLDYAWDFNTPGGLPNGFSNVLAETGEALRKLIAQAIGEAEPEPEPEGEAEQPESTTLAAADPVPGSVEPDPWPGLPPGLALEASLELVGGALPPAQQLAEASPLPEGAVRLSEALPPPLQAVAEEPPPARPRRHGGALPI